MPSARVLPSSTTSSTRAPGREEDAVLRDLRAAKLTALHIVSWSRPGFFRATLERPNAEGPALAMMMLAVDQHPIAFRRPYAFAHLARVLGMRVVPPTVVRHVSTDELGALLAEDADARAYMSAHAAIQNDGTIDALMVAPSRGDARTAWRVVTRRELVLEEAPEIRAWSNALASIEPVPGENKALLHDYVEALVLDYLACNVMRRSVQLDDAANELVLTENDGAFPTKNFAHAEAHMLDRLKPTVRFPRALRDALTAFHRDRAREIFMSGSFESWILSPRHLMLVDERRLAVLSLIASRIEEYGENAVLSL